MRCINGFQGLILKGEMYRNLPGSQENKGIVNPRNFNGIKKDRFNPDVLIFTKKFRNV